MRSLRLALQFLTVLPLRIPGEVTPREHRAALAWFPAVGLGIGWMLVALHRWAWPSAPPRIDALLLVASGLLLTGVLHLDGLADVADALCARKDREGRLAVMKDPRVGAAGGAAIALALGMRWELLAALSPAALVPALLAAPVVGRAAMVLALRVLPPARPDGLARAWSPPPGLAVLVAIGMGLGLPAWALDPFPGLRAAAAAALAAGMLLSVSGRIFGGVTGDVCGAAGELSELAFLGGVLAWGPR